MLIDDQEIQQKKVEFYCSKLGYRYVGIQHNFDDVFDLIESEKPDMILQDINLNYEINGIELARRIKKKFNLPLIFTTSHKTPEMIKKAAATEPQGYLAKPYEIHNLQAAIELSLFKSGNHETTEEVDLSEKDTPSGGKNVVSNAFFVKGHDKIEKVLIENILWIESAEEKYINIVTDAKKLRMRSSLNKVLDQLPNELFARVNRNQVINIKHLEAIDEFEESVIVAGRDLLIGKVFKTRIINLINIIN